MENNIKKNVLLIITVLLVGLGLAGGTYAWFSSAATITNGNYATDTHCFDVSYSYNSNEDGTFVPAIGQSNLIGTVTDYEEFSFINGTYVYDTSDSASFTDPYITFNFSSQLVANKQYVLQFDADINCSYPYSYTFPSSSGANAREFINGENTLFFTPQSSINSGTLTMTFNTSTDYDIVTLSNFRIYDIESGNLVGTLFPSGTAAGGINGGITAAISPSCALTTGRGTLYLHVDSGTSTDLTSTVDGHCEVINSLETLSDIDSSTTCSSTSGAHWVTDGTALKYMVFSGGDLYSSGYIKTTDIGNDIQIHNDFSVTTTSKTWDVYIWLDGYLSGEDYANLPFSGTIRMNTMQIKSTDTTFTGDTPISLGYLD